MASSIHIAKGHSGSVAHNSRDTPTKNAIFSDELNECSHSTKEAFSIYRDELQLRTVAYTQNTGQKLQSKAITHLSAVVNLEQHHKLEDIKPLIKHLELTLDTKVFQVAIHRDEGHVNADMKDVKNYHAHIEFMGLDTEGKSVRKKLTKKYLSDLQTETANILKMERGRNYAKEQAPRPKRLDTYEYKDYKQREAKEIKSKVATIAELKETIKELRAELKENKAVRSDYAALESLSKELKAKVESKDLTIQELKGHKKALIASISGVLKREQREELSKLEPLEQFTKAGEFVKDNILGFKNNANKALERTKPLQAENDTLKSDLNDLRADMSVLRAKNYEAKAVNNKIKKEIKEVIPSDFEPKKSLKERFMGFITELKETIKVQASEILSLKNQNQELQKDLDFKDTKIEEFLDERSELISKADELENLKSTPGVQEVYSKYHFDKILNQKSNDYDYDLSR